MKEIPKFYNCLEETKKEIFSLLFQGVKKRKSNFHNFVLNTMSLNNTPEARTVVLRDFCSQNLTINIHSDGRAKKISELKKNKNVCLVFYDEGKKIQLRIKGIAQIQYSNKESWEKLSNWSKRCYLTIQKPGMISKEPTGGFPESFSTQAPSSDESEVGLKNFAVIKIFISDIEWLFLASNGHRRALFEIKRKKSGIDLSCKWLIP